MEIARIKLAEMEEFVPLLWSRIIIVYDAYRIKGKAFYEYFKGLEVIYTGEGETADAFIERLVVNLMESLRILRSPPPITRSTCFVERRPETFSAELWERLRECPEIMKSCFFHQEQPG